VRAMGIDLMSFSGHKLYGPKGVGVLFVSRSPRIRLEPQMHGGSHQFGMRAGTLPTHQIVGMGEAFRIAREYFQEDNDRITRLRNYFWQELSSIPEIHLNGDEKNRVGGCLNIRVDHVDSEILLNTLPKIAVSTGSACNSANPEPSHVLTAMGLSRDQANSSIRISIGKYTIKKEVDDSVVHIKEQITRLLGQPSLWNKIKHKISKNMD